MLFRCARQWLTKPASNPFFRFSLYFSVAQFWFVGNRLLAPFHFFLRYLYMFQDKNFFFFSPKLVIVLKCVRLNAKLTAYNKKEQFFFSPKRHVLHCSIQFNTKSNHLYLFFKRRTKSVFFQFTESIHCQFVTVKQWFFSVFFSSYRPSIHSYEGVWWECGTNWQWDEWNC